MLRRLFWQEHRTGDAEVRFRVPGVSAAAQAQGLLVKSQYQIFLVNPTQSLHHYDAHTPLSLLLFAQRLVESSVTALQVEQKLPDLILGQLIAGLHFVQQH